MAGQSSEYERYQIESLLQSGNAHVERDSGLFLVPQLDALKGVYDAAVAPALCANGIGVSEVVRVFGSESQLAEVGRYVLTAEVIVADLTWVNADLMYILGLCHGLHRCPILISQDPWHLPFNLDALRCIKYEPGNDGLWSLRKDLTRAVRVFLAATRAKS